MNDHLLGEWASNCITSLDKRAKSNDEKHYISRELTWYRDCIRALVNRVKTLEGETAETLTARDEIALRLLPTILALNSDKGMAMGRALMTADLYLEARRVPPVPVVVPNGYHQIRKLGTEDWQHCAAEMYTAYSQIPGYQSRIVFNVTKPEDLQK